MLIKTEEEYAAALARMDEIFDAAPGTPEGDELSAIADAMGAYEDIHFPMGTPSAEAMAEFRREQEGR